MLSTVEQPSNELCHRVGSLATKAVNDASSLTAPFDICGAKKLHFPVCDEHQVAHALQPYGDFMVASEGYGPVQGWDYHALISSASSGLEAGELFKQTVENYISKVRSFLCEHRGRAFSPYRGIRDSDFALEEFSA
jgi:hypothetical protein